VPFWGVDAEKISDRLTVRILEVNGREADKAVESGYVRIFSKK